MNNNSPAFSVSIQVESKISAGTDRTLHGPARHPELSMQETRTRRRRGRSFAPGRLRSNAGRWKNGVVGVLKMALARR
jgi:hypothetical protein